MGFSRLLEWVAISYSRGSSQTRDRTSVSYISCIGRQVLYHCAAWDAWKPAKLHAAGEKHGSFFSSPSTSCTHDSHWWTFKDQPGEGVWEKESPDFWFYEPVRSWESQLCKCVCVCVLDALSCLTLCDSMDCSPPDSSVHGNFQVKTHERVAIPFSRTSSWSWGWTRDPCIIDRFFTIWATRKVRYQQIAPLSIIVLLWINCILLTLAGWGEHPQQITGPGSAMF